MEKNAKITILGVGTCDLNPDHPITSSVLLQFPGTPVTNIVFDFGRGVAMKLAQMGIYQDDISHIIISHFHPDHVSDLIPYLHAASWSQRNPRTSDLHIYGPTGIKKLMERMFSLCGTGDLNRDTFDIHIHEIQRQNFEINEQTFTFADLPPANNHGIKFEYNSKIVAITGDSHFHEKEIAFLQDVDLAIVDAGHISEKELIALATQTQAKKLVCSHLYRDIPIKQIQKRSPDFNGEFILGYSGQTFLI